MAKIGLLNAFGSTVGDNLEHHLIAHAIQGRGHKLLHLCNFNNQQPPMVKQCHGLVAGCGGILWKGSPLRDYFFINVIMLARRAVAISIGYNQGEPLSVRWIRAVNKMEFLTARDPWTLTWAQKNCRTPAKCHPSVAWTYQPPKTSQTFRYDVGLIINQGANKINLGIENPFKLFPGLRGVSALEIPFAQPLQQPFRPTVPNQGKKASIASMTIRKCRVVFTSRLHGFILALLNGVPAIIQGDGFKISSQAQMCGYPLERNITQLRALTPQGWRELIREAEGVDPQAYVPKMRAQAAKHIEALDLWLKTF